MKKSPWNLTLAFLSFACRLPRKGKGVSLGSSVMEKKITMTSSQVDGLKVGVYLSRMKRWMENCWPRQ